MHAGIEQNIRIHDRIAGAYEGSHGEIFNTVEQGRLRRALGKALAAVASGGERPHVLDYGCGSGNLTRHLLDLGAHVTAADVSSAFVAQVASRYQGRDVDTALLNGRDLSQFADASFDGVATYSVLHHIPDYRAAVREMARVLRPGGILFLDHEPTPDYWTPSEAYRGYRKAVETYNWAKFLSWRNYYGKIRRLVEPRYANEGDIHVWPDDHIEWDAIVADLTEVGCAELWRDDYLLFRRGYRPHIYEAAVGTLTDTRLMVFTKGKDGRSNLPE